jgi:hypothetical protein
VKVAGGNSIRAATGGISTFYNISTNIIMMKRE